MGLKQILDQGLQVSWVRYLKKQVIIFINMLRISFIVEVKIQNLAIVDVDVSYLYKKQQAHSQADVRVASLPPPSTPLSGWHTTSEVNVASIAANIPCLSSGAELT